MTLKEAYKILGASKDDSDREIKVKYKKLLIMYHPDSDPTRERAPEDDEKIRQVIEAYRKIRESEGETVYDTHEFTWDAFENRKAFSERNIFVQFRIYDEALPPSKMARGRFVWDPDMEEFPMFAKSVFEACKEVMADHDVLPSPDKVKDIFHLMMQEYVLPVDTARKLGKKLDDVSGAETAHEAGDAETYAFNGFIDGDIDEGEICGTISFDEDELYYVVLPLLDDPRIKTKAYITKVESSRRRIKERKHITIELTIPKDLVDTPVVNEDLIRNRIH